MSLLRDRVGLRVQLGQPFQLDIFEAQSFSVHRARQDYECDHCEGAIGKGALYLVVTPGRVGYIGGDRYRYRYHIEHAKCKLTIQDRQGNVIRVVEAQEVVCV